MSASPICSVTSRCTRRSAPTAASIGSSSSPPARADPDAAPGASAASTSARISPASGAPAPPATTASMSSGRASRVFDSDSLAPKSPPWSPHFLGSLEHLAGPLPAQAREEAAKA